MSRNTLNKLTDRQCKAAKPRDKTYKLSDGGGLYLEVSQTGSKYWRMKYRRPSDKKEDRLAFGVYPTISLQDAREKRDNAKKLLVKGIDPKAEQRAAKAEEKGAFTFETIGRQWVESHQMWNEAHRKRVLRSLEMYIFPHIGTSDIRKLEAMTILPLFKKVDDAGKHDTANRLKQRVKDIIHSARLSGIKTEIITNDLDVRLPGEEGTFNVRKGEDFLYHDDEDDWYGSYDSFYFKRSEVVNFFPELDMNVPDNEPEIGALSKKVEREQNWRGKDTALKMIAGMAIALFESSKDFHSGGNLSINRVSAQVIENNIIFGNDEDSDTHPDTFRRLLTNALDKYAPKFKNKATKKRPK